MRRAIASLALCLALPWGMVCGQDKQRDAAPELGRLFFTAAEREQLERDRGRASDTPVVDTPESVSVSGLISRAGQPALPVINGRIVFPGENPSGLRISGRTDGRIAITRPDGPARLARPGQFVDLVTGETRELYDLPGRRDTRGTQGLERVPYTTGTAPKVDTAPLVKPAKAKRPRRHGGRHGSSSAANPPAHAPPAPPPSVAPPNAAAPTIPAPLPRQR